MELLTTVWNFIKEWQVIFIMGTVILLYKLRDKIFSLFKKKKTEENVNALQQQMDGTGKLNLREKRVLAQKWIDYTIQKAAALKQRELELTIEREDMKKKHDYYVNKMKMLDILIQQEEMRK